MSDSDSGSDFEPEKAKKSESSEEQSESEVKPKKDDKKKGASKSKKPEAKKRKVESEEEEEGDDSEEEKEKTPPKKGKKSAKKSEECELPGGLDLGNNRFVTSNDFKGKKYIHIREYYRPNEGGKLLPTKKGISFTPDQLKNLIAKIPEIEEKFL